MLGEYQELENEEISVCETNYSNYTGLCDYMFVSRYGQNYSIKGRGIGDFLYLNIPENILHQRCTKRAN